MGCFRFVVARFDGLLKDRDIIWYGKGYVLGGFRLLPLLVIKTRPRKSL